MNTDALIIFDTTLRDGEQSPGASMTQDEKVRIARALEQLQVNVIEAGFPAASPGDFAAVKAVAEVIKNSTVCALARALPADIERAAAAIQPAQTGRIHTFIATSPLHMRHKLRMEPEQVLEQAIQAVTLARQYTDDVEFSAEDAGRSDMAFLCQIIEAAINAGARTINIPDTVGYNLPSQFGQTLRTLKDRVPNADQAIFSVHCHNDLGLAVANSLAAVAEGARQVECTINGLGERAGNAALEEIVMAVRTRRDMFDCDIRIDTTQIVNCSKLVANITGFPVQPNKAIVGANAFAHESGIHQDGVLKHRETYEIMRAEDVGWHTNRMVLGKHSGRNAFRAHLEKLGTQFATEEALNIAFNQFKELADKKHDIFDEDLQAIVTETSPTTENDRIQYVALQVTTATGQTPEATVTIQIDGNEHQATTQGDGPVDACYTALHQLIGLKVDLQLYSVNNITQGTDSQGEVTVRLEQAGHLVNGQGADTDILVASVKAYINGCNKLYNHTQKAHPQHAIL